MNNIICPVCKSQVLKNHKSYLSNYHCSNHFSISSPIVISTSFDSCIYAYVIFEKYKLVIDEYFNKFSIIDLASTDIIFQSSQVPKLNLNDPECLINLISKINFYLSFQ